MLDSTVSPSPLGPYWEETDERGEIRVAHIDGGGVTVYSTRSAWYSRLAVLKKGGTWEEADDVYVVEYHLIKEAINAKKKADVGASLHPLHTYAYTYA